MTDWFVDSGASGANDGTSKTDAYTGVVALLAGAFAAGDRVFGSHTHVEGLTADTTLTFPGTRAAPNEIHSVNFAGSTPPVAADNLFGAKIDCDDNLKLNGSFHFINFDIRAGETSTTGGDQLELAMSSSVVANQKYENCKLSNLSTNGSAKLTMGLPDSGSNEGQTVELIDCVLGLGGINQSIQVQNCSLKWRNSEGLGVAMDITSTRHKNPTLHLFDPSATGSSIEVDGLDLSNLSALDGLFNVGRNEGSLARLTISNCKVHSVFALVTGTRQSSAHSLVATLVNCDDGDTNYLLEQDSEMGNVVTDTARTLNATDGTTAFSWKMVSSPDANFGFPLYTPWIPVWIDSPGSKTVTLEFLHDGGVTDLNDDEVSIEVMYALNTADPLYGLVTDRMVPLATPAAQADSVEGDWTEDLANENAQKAVTASITVNEKGLIYTRLALAKASQTIWVDPDPVVA